MSGNSFRSAKQVRRLLPLAGIFGLLAMAAYAVPPGTEDEIRARLQPFGSLCRAGDDCGSGTAMAAAAAASAPSGPLSGEAVYNQFCFACHMTGASGAPKLDDPAAWEPRIAKGRDELWNSLVNGIGVMPARGTCMSCSDEELEAVLDYMVAEVQ
jgi:cytochrome c5